MIILATTSISISAPIETIFEYVTNMENYKQWFPGVIHIKSANDVQHGTVGKTYVETLSLPNGNVDLIIEVVQCETNRLFLTQGDLPGIFPQMTITFSNGTSSHCHMNLQYHSRSNELTLTSDLVQALQEDLTIRANDGVKKLKSILENTHSEK